MVNSNRKEDVQIEIHLHKRIKDKLQWAGNKLKSCKGNGKRKKDVNIIENYKRKTNVQLRTMVDNITC